MIICPETCWKLVGHVWKYQGFTHRVKGISSAELEFKEVSISATGISGIEGFVTKRQQDFASRIGLVHP